MMGNAENRGGRRGSRWRIAAWSAAALMLLLPLFAMQVIDQVVWEVGDFALFAALLVGVGVTYEVVAKMTGNAAYRCAAGVALAATFLLVWVNGAVGIIGDASNDANSMYGGVLAVGMIGGIIARFQPRGMARAMLATALAQVLVAVIAQAASASPIWPRDVVILTGLFTALWLISARLFRKATRGEAELGAG